MSVKNTLNVLCFVMVSVLMTGCTALGPKHKQPNTDELLNGLSLPSDYRDDNDVLSQWWTYFNDSKLNDLVKQSLDNNRDLIALRANLNASRANLNLARIDYLPSDSITASVTESRQSAAALGVASGFQDIERDLYTLSFAPQWDIDLFGVVSRQVEIAKRNYYSQKALLDDLQLIVIGELVSQYFQRQSLGLEQRTLEANIELQTQSLDIAQTQFKYGRGNQLNVINARAQLRATQAQLPPVLATISQVEARLAVLTGRAPGALHQALSRESSATYIQQALPIGDLSALIRRQPSIRAAEHNLASSISEIGLTISSLFPQVSFGGSVGYSAQQRDQLGDSDSLQFVVGPTLSWSLNNLIRAKPRIRAAQHQSAAALAEYENTVLTALEDLNTALSNQKSARDRQPLLDLALTDSRESARITRAQYEFGAAAFNDLLDSEQRLLQQELDTNRGVIDIINAQVAVFRALGAG